MSRSLCALAVLALLLTAPAWARRLRSAGLSLQGFPGSVWQLYRESGRQEELAAARARFSRLQEARQRVLTDLAQGRLKLLEAARLWRDLFPAPPEEVGHLLIFVGPGGSDGERLCRYTIHRVGSTLDLRPEEARRAVARLEAELEEHLARHGTVTLPEPRRLEGYDGPGH
jgi:hypothetical protein